MLPARSAEPQAGPARAPGRRPGTGPSPAVHTIELRKQYRRTVALAGLSMTVQRGEVFGFLGPNGAGKTTAVKLLLGLARPDRRRGDGPRRPGGRPGDPAAASGTCPSCSATRAG